ncbi:hypothetical protein [Bacillus toyonensis]|uniref:hypothetical protein n=1 Tax=Bacillus toyonensis TaxID=155322 RepID=UPI00027BEA55|nr:hypothetical protein [Bacillus toyonensis]EJV41753.1 hypothetical protein IEA_05638 [Bacillus toyonensis]
MIVHRLLTEEEKMIAEGNGICEKTLYSRLYNSEFSDRWTIEDAITIPTGTKRSVYSVENRTFVDLAKQNGLYPVTYHERLKLGWEPYRAATKPKRKYRKKVI